MPNATKAMQKSAYRMRWVKAICNWECAGKPVWCDAQKLKKKYRERSPQVSNKHKTRPTIHQPQGCKTYMPQ